MKSNKRIERRKIAKEILKAEKEIREGKNVQKNKEKIEMIMSSLSFEEMIALDNYINKK